jgi:hypothetical protein
MQVGVPNDIELVEHAQFLAEQNQRELRLVLVHGRRDCTSYEDVKTKERRILPNKYVRAIGPEAAFELVAIDPQSLTPTNS